MRNSLVVLALLTAHGTWAQPVLTVENSLPVAGESFIELMGPALGAGGAGADQVWDLSAFQATDTLAFTYENTADDSIGGCPLNCPYDLIGGDYAVALDPPRISVAPSFGYPLGTLPITTECSRMLQLPMGFGEVFQHQHLYHIHTNGCSEILMWREETSVADGYGSLVLPFGTFGPVLRVHTTTGHIVPDGPVRNAYRFYLPGTHHPLVTIAEGFPLALDTIWSMRMLDPASIVGLPEDPLIGDILVLKPQPVQDLLFVEIPNELLAAAEVSIMDISGRPVQRHDPMDLAHGLDVSGLSTGSYVLRITRAGSPTLSSHFIKTDR